MKRLIIVTGATGHLGLNLIHLLVAQGEKVRVLVLPNDKLAQHLPPMVEQCVGSITHAEDIKRLFESTDEPIVVIHCAGIVSIGWAYQSLVHQVNVEGTRLLVGYLKDHKVERFIYISSVHALSEQPADHVITESIEFDPSHVTGDYAKTKAEAAQIVINAIHEGLPGTIVFPSGMIGPFDYARGNTTQTLLDAAHGKLPLCVKGGYDFVDVRDVSQTLIRIMNHPSPSPVYILSNRYVSISEILTTVATLQHKRGHHLIVPHWIATLFLPLFALYYRFAHQKPTFTRYSLYTLRSHTLFSHQLATDDLAFEPRPIHDSIRDTLQWFRVQGWLVDQRWIKQPKPF